MKRLFLLSAVVLLAACGPKADESAPAATTTDTTMTDTTMADTTAKPDSTATKM